LRVSPLSSLNLTPRDRCVGGPGSSEVEDEDFHDAVCIAAMRLVCRPGNARNAVAIAAISANRQADKKPRTANSVVAQAMHDPAITVTTREKSERCRAVG
jgi:hypothetical protein